jgi:hypothetical protein
VIVPIQYPNLYRNNKKNSYPSCRSVIETQFSPPADSLVRSGKKEILSKINLEIYADDVISRQPCFTSQPAADRTGLF